VAYAGLAPYLAGVYQVNVTIPTTVSTGDNVIEIGGPDSDNYQALISVGTASVTSAAKPAPQPQLTRQHRLAKPGSGERVRPCFVIDKNCSAPATL
jgi:hypothetical protein